MSTRSIICDDTSSHVWAAQTSHVSTNWSSITGQSSTGKVLVSASLTAQFQTTSPVQWTITVGSLSLQGAGSGASQTWQAASLENIDPSTFGYYTMSVGVGIVTNVKIRFTYVIEMGEDPEPPASTLFHFYGNSAVICTISPADMEGQTSITTVPTTTVRYPIGTSVTIVAPATSSNGIPFTRWIMDWGPTISTTPTAVLVADDFHQLKAIYTSPTEPLPPTQPPTDPPITPPTAPQTDTVFAEDLPDRVTLDMDYTVHMTAKYQATGLVNPYAHGKLKVAFMLNSATTWTTRFTVNGADPNTTLINFTAGQATFTIRFPLVPPGTPPPPPFAAGNHIDMLTVSVTDPDRFTGGANNIVHYDRVSSPGANFITTDTPGLLFTTQPPATIDVGAKFNLPVVVKIVKGTSTVDTAWTGDVTLTMRALNGALATEFLGGVKTITPIAGVATFPTLFIAKIGSYTLHATSKVGAITLDGVSTNIQVSGDDDQQELRQNLRDDGTIWTKTTNITPPVYGAFGQDDPSTLDGDEAVNANVVFDGTRWCFPYTMKVTLVRFKVALSTIAAAPTIQLYSSQDTTTGQNGTWTLVTSMTPSTTRVNVSEFSLSEPVYAKGLWLTLNDNGGAATAAWYSQQVMGKYLGTPVSYLSVVDAMAGENYMTIPSPLVVLGGAQTKFRSFQVRNNTAAAMRIIASPEPARSTGDALMDSDNLSILDQDGNIQTNEFTVPAFASKLLQLRYGITAAENDKSGSHYGRITFTKMDGETGWFASTLPPGPGLDTINVFRSLLTGASVGSVTGQGINVSKAAYPQKRKVWTLQKPEDATASVYIGWMNTRNGVPTSEFSEMFINTWTGGQEDHVSGLGILDKKLLISADDTTLIVIPPFSADANDWYPTTTRALCTTFSIPAQTSGHKRFTPGPGGSIFIMNGTAVNSIVYRMSSTGYVFNTLSPAAQMSGRTLRGCFWDDVNQELNVISSISAGNRIIARYKPDGTFLNSVSVTTEGTLEVTGWVPIPPYVYLFYGADKMYRHDLQTFANATLKFDLVTADYPGCDIVGVT